MLPLNRFMVISKALLLDVEVQAGNQAQSTPSLPSLFTIINKLLPEQRPTFVLGDCDLGSGALGCCVLTLAVFNDHYISEFFVQIGD